MVVITGVSGSGKSSLAFDTLFAIYLEDLDKQRQDSALFRGFLDGMAEDYAAELAPVPGAAVCGVAAQALTKMEMANTARRDRQDCGIDELRLPPNKKLTPDI